MEDKKFVKLSDLVGSEFTIQRVLGYSFKKWDAESKRMLIEDNYFEGAQKKYQIDTDKGKLDLSETQLASVFVKVQHHGQSDVNNVIVSVKSNGKTGMDIRYYLNPQKYAKPATDSYEPEMNFDEFGAPIQDY